jgi:hypothetical protein
LRHRKRDSGAGGSPPRSRCGAAARAMALVGLTVATSTACTPGQIYVSSSDTSPTLLVHDVRGRGNDADISGYLRYLDDADCFVLESEPGAERLVRNIAVWPPGTQTWQQDGQVAGVEVPDVGAIPLGNWVSGGGGYANPTTSDIDLPEVSSHCLSGDGEFAMLHRISQTGTSP